MKDGGWPSEVCLQGLASNRLELHRSKAVVVSVGGKGAANASDESWKDEYK